MTAQDVNAVIYARYSDRGQKEQSIEGQLRECYAFAEREGYNVVGEYIDRKLSAKTDRRPDFQRMVADAPKKQFSFVIVWMLDRFARNRYDSAIYKARLKKHGVRVLSATQNISDEPEGIILEGMLESMAEYYSANLSKHVRRGMHENVINGDYLGGTAPLGYKVADKKLVVDDDTAPTVRYVFEQYAAGVPKKRIIDDLNARGVRSKSGAPLSKSSFQSMLSNRKYIGEYMYDGQEVNGGCPALIDEKTFNAVQERRKQHARAGGANKARTEYLLQGKAFCGECGARLVGDSGRGKGGEVYHYYACGERKKSRDKSLSCKKASEKKGFLEWYVVEQTVNYVLRPERMDYIAGNIVAAYDKEFGSARIKDMERRLRKLDRDVSKLVDSLIALPAAAAAKVGQKIETLELQKADLEIDLSRLRIANGIKYTGDQIMSWMKSFCNGDLLDEAFQRRVIDVFINSVYVYDDRTVIYYNVKGGQQVSYIEMQESTANPPDDLCSNIETYGSPRGANTNSPRFFFAGEGVVIVFPLDMPTLYMVMDSCCSSVAFKKSCTIKKVDIKPESKKRIP